MWKDLTKRAAAVAAVTALSFGVVACGEGGVNLQDSPDVEEAPFGGTEDPLKETPAPDSS